MRLQKPWLSIIGIGEDGLAGLSLVARELLASAELVVGGSRHLKLIGETSAATRVWPSPPEAAFPQILSQRGTPVVVLASGDPFHYGIGSMLASHLELHEFQTLPMPSAFALAAARLGWAQQDCTTLSLHGRPLESIWCHVQPGARLLALSWDGQTPQKLARLLCARGLAQARLTICENLGGPREKISVGLAQDLVLQSFDPLNTIALEIPQLPARFIPRASGLPDDYFEHDGQITKRDVRAITLSALGPLAGECLWDIGAGSGSIAIEWLLSSAGNRAFAIEQNSERCVSILRNAAHLGVPHLTVIEGRAPAALKDLRRPEAIFIGGGASNLELVGAAMMALKVSGRLVVNAVTLETQAALIALYTQHGGECVNIQIATADPVGRFHGWRSAMPVMQWRWVRS